MPIVVRAIPLISVIMPLRNEVRFLVHAVQSILDQTLEDFELLRNGFSRATQDEALRRVEIQTAANAASGGLFGQAKAALAIARRHGALTSRDVAWYMRVWLSCERARRKLKPPPPDFAL
jgi:hypothetical protein